VAESPPSNFLVANSQHIKMYYNKQLNLCNSYNKNFRFFLQKSNLCKKNNTLLNR